MRYFFNRQIPSKSFVVKGIREMGQNLKGELRSNAGLKTNSKREKTSMLIC